MCLTLRRCSRISSSNSIPAKISGHCFYMGLSGKNLAALFLCRKTPICDAGAPSLPRILLHVHGLWRQGFWRVLGGGRFGRSGRAVLFPPDFAGEERTAQTG